MVDLHTQYLKIKPQIDEAMLEVANSCAFINGQPVRDFSEALANYNQVNKVVPCGNGTDALQIAIMALGFKPGDELVVPVHTYVATAEVIALLGLKPVFIDVDPETFLLDVNQLEDKISNKTVGIVPVHLYGQCADMESILTIANKHGLKVIEDTAQALGAAYTFSDGTVKKAGTMGDIGTTSFFPSKNLGCFGDGGAMLINDEDLAKKAHMIANHGQRIKYHHDIIGCNSRLDTIQAAILNVKLNYLDDYSAARNEVADEYDRSLNQLKGIKLPKRVKHSTHVFHQYTIRVDEKRDELKAYLQDKGIPTMIYYPVPLHLQKAYALDGFGNGAFPVTENLSRSVLSLPIHTEMKQEVQEYICNQIAAFYNGED